MNGTRLLCFVALLASTVTRTDAQSIALQPTRFTESRQADAPLGSDVIRGFHVGQALTPVKLDALRLLLPPGPSQLCLRLETQDGSYVADAVYTIGAERRPSGHQIQLPTRHRSFLESQTIGDLSLIAYVSNACDSPARTYVAARWAPTQGERTSMLLLVNAGGPSIDVRVFVPDRNQYDACRRDRQSARLVAFDTECIVDLTGLSGTVKLKILRDRIQKRLRDIDFELYLR